MKEVCLRESTKGLQKGLMSLLEVFVFLEVIEIELQ